MARVTKIIDDELVALCEEELKKQGIRGETGRRLQAIISAKKHGIKMVSKIYNISRETMMRWIRKFKEGGSAAFAVEAGRGRKYKLNPDQMEEIRQYVEIEGAQLSSKHLRLFIEERFKITISNATAHRILRGSGFSYITPRPSHHKKELEKQEYFKKKSTRRGPKK